MSKIEHFSQQLNLRKRFRGAHFVGFALVRLVFLLAFAGTCFGNLPNREKVSAQLSGAHIPICSKRNLRDSCRITDVQRIAPDRYQVTVANQLRSSTLLNPACIGATSVEGAELLAEWIYLTPTGGEIASLNAVTLLGESSRTFTVRFPSDSAVAIKEVHWRP